MKLLNGKSTVALRGLNTVIGGVFCGKGPSIKDVRTKSRKIGSSPLCVKSPHWLNPLPYVRTDTP